MTDEEQDFRAIVSSLEEPDTDAEAPVFPDSVEVVDCEELDFESFRNKVLLSCDEFVNLSAKWGTTVVRYTETVPLDELVQPSKDEDGIEVFGVKWDNEKISKEIDAYNKKLGDIDTTKPFHIHCVMVHDGVSYGCVARLQKLPTDELSGDTYQYLKIRQMLYNHLRGDDN